uniref:Uncharacterized protein n=1 Tax=Opuntia streptacantha TaxID=393608 RepID=A0A7C9DDV0_OPUST
MCGRHTQGHHVKIAGFPFHWYWASFGFEDLGAVFGEVNIVYSMKSRANCSGKGKVKINLHVAISNLSSCYFLWALGRPCYPRMHASSNKNVRTAAHTTRIKFLAGNRNCANHILCNFFLVALLGTTSSKRLHTFCSPETLLWISIGVLSYIFL